MEPYRVYRVTKALGFRGGSGATLNLLKPSRGALDAVTLNGAL